jgi:DNA topoisomerase-1
VKAKSPVKEKSPTKGKSLVIVESPAKSKTISKYLGKGFTVLASVGHVRDLPKSKFGVDVEHDFLPSYQLIRGKDKVIKEIKAAAKKADAIYLAPDPDREGEAIAWHLAETINAAPEKVFRVAFNEITAEAVRRAFDSPGRVDMNKVDAQQARRVLDRIVGYKLSPILWDKVRRGISAGRVQSVALRLVCDRETEIRAFRKREYWSLTARLGMPSQPDFLAKLLKVDGAKAEIPDEATATGLLDRLGRAPFVVDRVGVSQRRRNPLPPFITSQLQQDAVRRLGFTSKKTMMLAQRLYEGVDLPGEGQVALITYMRTDSPRVSNEAQGEALAFIRSEYGPAYVPEKPNVFRPRKAGKIQDAHECIRPTSSLRRPDQVRGVIERDLARLYELIWSRFVASQMTPAVYHDTSADILADGCLFRATGSRLSFDGHLRAFADQVVAEAEREEKEGDEDSLPVSILPAMEKGDQTDLRELLPKQHFTQPPPRYTEATLIKALEENGVGRPSTYATIIATILGRDYSQKEKGKLIPTELGMTVNELLVRHFPEVSDIEFTARMEDTLDSVEEGRRGWVEILREFYGPFMEDIGRAQVEMKNVKTEMEPTDIPCKLCGRLMVIRWGKKGRFLACPGYPECTNTGDFTREEDGTIRVADGPGAEDTGIVCDKCGKPMVIRKSRRGPFLACSGYPECKNASNFSRNDDGTIRVEARESAEETGIVCDKCGKPMVIRQSRRGPFLSCSAYPGCKNAKNFTRDDNGAIKVEVPQVTEEVCEKCGKPMIVKRTRRGPFLACSGYPDCKNLRKAPGLAAASAPAAPPEEAGVVCDQCGKPMIIRQGRFGKFIACSGYPGCKNSMPLPKPPAA